MTLSKLSARPLTPTEIDSEVQKFVQDLSGMGGLEKMILFGSAATKKMTEASDIDLVLIFQTKETARQASKNVQQKRKTAKWPADILCVDTVKFNEASEVGGILYVAKREGTVVFENKKL